MKALTLEKYGLPEEVLRFTNQKIPTYQKNEVLVKIHFTAINDYDWSLVRGKPFIYRLMFGLVKPKSKSLGMELSGTVEAVGSEVTEFDIGDEVYGDTSAYGFGTFSEYIALPANALVHKPKNMSFEEAAALPHAALLALQGLKDIGGIKNGMKVLINGAGGGVGTLALQLAKTHHCEVTGVDLQEKFEALSNLGYDHLINYQHENFTENGIQYDLILDCKTDKSPFSYSRSLTANGVYVSIGGKITYLLSTLIIGKALSAFSSKRFEILSLKPNQGLKEIEEMYVNNQIKPVIDGPYPLSLGPEKLQEFGNGYHIGKIILSLGT
ncbi:NAD(P)-dependent alcohol dehydrogenase [Cyclobacterium marinum]|uniref:NAD(P)-dependent alcohol dehydrogenase n=1 Tax=Cyclobacterium marinum TaxID=104 RepID=UPI0011EF66F8|nr:NAD(P)-dependent alcohol dehydrogenase [Cyclobacterium marinum]MBI0398353.1 NAD(P)-dependent alcohol dehydrogenase [Cyclobacterium marinum]